MKQKSDKKITIRISSKLLDELRGIAIEHDTTLTSVIIYFIEKGLENANKN